MRTAVLLALALLGAAPAWAAEEPSGCDKFKWPIERERAALTAPDRAKLASGGELAALPSTGVTLALVAPGRRQAADAARARAQGRHLCRLRQHQDRAQGRPLHGQPVLGRLGRRGAGRPFPQAEGVQRRHRLRRHPQDHEIRAFGEPVRAAGQRHQGQFDLDRDPADRIAQAPVDEGSPLPGPSACYCPALAISRSAVSHRDCRNSASACRIPDPTNA